MSQQLTLKLSNETYAALNQQASAVGLSLSDWIVAELNNKKGKISRQLNNDPRSEAQKEEARRRFRSHAGAVELGYATGSDNESIDDDLAKAYANDY
jgi:hypothetical protein